MYDLIIIGAGPAGITASVYAARKRMNVLVISEDIGGQAAWSGDIENYTGYQFVSGPELSQKFEEHMQHYNIPLKEGQTVTGLKKDGDVITVVTKDEAFDARTVIVASGKRPRELNVPGEKEFKNRGVTYCATCDGPLFHDKDVAVIGGGNSALDAALQLMSIARHVHIINIADELTGDEIMREKVTTSENVTVMNRAEVTMIQGEVMVTGIEIAQHDSAPRVIPVQGMFIEIGLIPNAQFADILTKNEYGEIIVDNKNQTNMPGIFASGDVTDVPEKQIIIAAGEGSKATLSAFRYISEHRF